MSGRTILHVDMDAFFAAVEVLDDSTLRGKPVIVGGKPEHRGVVSAASYEARAFGVHSAMSMARAVKLCPDGVFRRGRMERYQEISRNIFAIFKDFTPLVEPVSIDEAWLDVTGCWRLFGTGPEIGRLIKERIRQELGLVASVGVAPNKFLAKLASDLEKPDGFVVIAAERAPALLAELPVGCLWGIGKVAGEDLKRFGILKVRDLLAVPVDNLVQQFGDHARRLRELALGQDERPVIPVHQAKSIGGEITFAEDIADADQLRSILDQLTEKIGRRLRDNGFLARTVTVKIRYPDFTTLTRAQTLSCPTDASVVLRKAARRLLDRRRASDPRPLRLLGITAGGLSPVSAGVQADLFGNPELDRQRDLDRVLDQVHGRYGTKLQRGADSGLKRQEPGKVLKNPAKG